MKSTKHCSSGLPYKFHNWLVVCFVTVFFVGEPAILHAGPCEDCEKTKIGALKDCETDRTRDEANCVTDANAAQAKCENDRQGAIAKAEVDRESDLKAALGAYYIAVGVCALMPPPANLGCLYTVSGGYAIALSKAERDYQSKLTKAEIDRATCDKNWQVALKACREKVDNAHSGCVKKANDAYDACKGKCAGPPQI